MAGGLAHPCILLLLIPQVSLVTSNEHQHISGHHTGTQSYLLSTDERGASTLQHERRADTRGEMSSGAKSALQPDALSEVVVHGNATAEQKQGSMVRSQKDLPLVSTDHVGGLRFQYFLTVLAVLLVVSGTLRLSLGVKSTDQPLDALSAAMLCGAYIAIAASSDILVKWETQANGGTLPFAPARMVFVVEILKLSLTIPIALGRCVFNDVEWPEKDDILAAVRLMFIPAMAYSVNNAIIYAVVSRIDFSTLTVWRQLTPLFVASIWVLIFRRALGPQRWFALALLVAGTALNSLGQISELRLHDFMIMVVLFSCLTTAIAGVANEYVFKRCGRLDIDLLCVLLYVQTSAISFILAATMESRPVTFLTGVVPTTQADTLLGGPPLVQEPRLLVIILLQVIFGFAVARVIRYLGAVPRAIVNALKELTVVVTAPVFTDSHLNGTIFVSAIIVGGAAALFTLAPSPLPASKAASKAWRPEK